MNLTWNIHTYQFSKPSTSASFRVSSQPMKVLEIPAYRKNQLANNSNASPPATKIPDIPTFQQRKSSDWQPTPIDNTNQDFQQIQLPTAVNSDLLRRLKSSEHVRRSIDCIAAQTKADANVTVAESTPTGTSSWSNVAQRSESLTSNSGVGVSSSKKTSIDDETKGKCIKIRTAKLTCDALNCSHETALNPSFKNLFIICIKKQNACGLVVSIHLTSIFIEYERITRDNFIRSFRYWHWSKVIETTKSQTMETKAQR